MAVMFLDMLGRPWLEINIGRFIWAGCSEDETGADTEVGGCADGTASGGVGGGGGGGEGGSTKQGERCPQCGILCRNLNVLQLHLEDIHKTTYVIDKHDLGAQFSQVVSGLSSQLYTHRIPYISIYSLFFF